MRETTAPTLTRCFKGDCCEVSVTSGGIVTLRLFDEFDHDQMTPEQLEQLAQDLASASNSVRAAVAKFKRQQQAVAT